LAAEIGSGTFRSDLFYRLNVFPINVPPLRQRKEDIPMLVEYFVKRYAEKAGKQIRKIDKNTLKLCSLIIGQGIFVSCKTSSRGSNPKRRRYFMDRRSLAFDSGRTSCEVVGSSDRERLEL